MGILKGLGEAGRAFATGSRGEDVEKSRRSGAAARGVVGGVGGAIGAGLAEVGSGYTGVDPAGPEMVTQHLPPFDYSQPAPSPLRREGDPRMATRASEPSETEITRVPAGPGSSLTDTISDVVGEMRRQGPQVMLFGDPAAVLEMEGRGSEVDPSVNFDMSEVSPFVGLGAADRERLQGALGSVNERYMQNVADIEEMEALRDPRRREISEAQIEHALRLAERIPLEDELSEMQLQRKIKGEMPHGPGTEMKMTAAQELAQRPALEMQEYVTQAASAAQEVLTSFGQDPSQWTPQQVQQAQWILSFLGQLSTGSNFGALGQQMDPQTMMMMAQMGGAGGVNQGQGTVPQ